MARGQSAALLPATEAGGRQVLFNEMHRLRNAADRPGATPADVAALREFFKAHPGLITGVRALAETTEAVLFKKVVSHAGTREFCREELRALRNRLGYGGASEMERLLIAQVCLSWLRLQWVECQAAEMAMSEGGTIPVVMCWEKRLLMAQKRFTRAIESLARVRKLSEHRSSPKASLALIEATMREGAVQGLRQAQWDAAGRAVAGCFGAQE